MEKVISYIMLGVLAGVVFAEFRPETFESGIGQIAAILSKPFSPYRNELALKYGIFGGVGEAILGFIFHNISRNKESKK